ncbi:succinyldiaminopimelate transaminase [Moraxella atlantae]|uniref:LL-diaminopimelate aminotransferase n=1 Tax=Faucicola atlantae TaxID=34059 RepID=A0A378Q1H1_9GAMM|nr:succinyldiaminopimelate transaminase [Moraxella atlantae]OPH36601.1 succinyldiaminopimelate transaminase [Moraxella atlantae]STY94376.1 LL-diaminopimelate aminotransferase [Moraxella atlantae]
MNPKLATLQPYPFTKMATLLQDITPNPNYKPIKLGIGEPQHAPPEFVLQVLADNLGKVQNYPSTLGLAELRAAIADWVQRRFGAVVDSDHEVLPVMGTREALFSFVQATFDPDDRARPYVVMPNPFYQIYEGAAKLAGATPYFVNCTADNSFVGDYDAVPPEVWQQTQLVFVCSPNNPTGAVMSAEQWQRLLALSEQYGFILASDECYSELYFDTPPVGLLQVCAATGRTDFARCVVFHSLSKRSNLPGLRSGFVAGDARLLAPYTQYRTYQGCAMPLHHQIASIAAWQDETHVEANRALYRQKFALWLDILGDKLPLRRPDAGFYFWLPVRDDEQFVKVLYEQLNIHALAGRYLSRDTPNGNAGMNHVRMALVADVAQSEQAIARLLTLDLAALV